MKCTTCSYENPQNFSFCPNCGTPVQPRTAAQYVLPALKSQLFLILCILMGAGCILSLADEALPLLSILITVFLWLTYSQSKKNIADANHLRCVSGCVYAMYIINYVAAALVAVVGIICTVALQALISTPGNLEMLLGEIVDAETVAIISQALSFIPTITIFIAFAIISIAVILFNIFSIRYLHRFIQSVYRSLEQDVLALSCVNAAQICLYIIAGIYALNVLANWDEGIISILVNVILGAVAIIAGILIRKYLITQPEALN